jgi:hypothetical protein
MWCRLNLEELVEPDHPLRAVKRMVDRALSEMSRSFSAAYAANGRPGALRVNDDETLPIAPDNQGDQECPPCRTTRWVGARFPETPIWET